MKQILLLSVLCCIHQLFAQCPPVANTNTTNENQASENNVSADDQVNLHDVRTGHWEYSPEKQSIPQGIQIGFGVQDVVSSMITFYPERGKNSTAHNDWNNHGNYGYAEISYRFNTRLPFTVGLNGSWTKRWKNTQDYEALPPEQAPQDIFNPYPVAQASSLNWTFDQSFKTSNYFLFGELDFFSLKNGLIGFVRGEVGFSYFSANATISYRDTCGCSENAVNNYASGSIFTVGTGLGLKWEYKFLGLKAFMGHQFQKSANVSFRNDFPQWGPAFNAAEYDFKGNPSNASFSIEKPETRIAKRNDVFYFQAGVYFNLGYRK